MTSLIPFRFFASRCSAVAFATCFAASLDVRAAAAGCEPPHREEHPAAGHWTGHFKLAYELLIPRMPPGMKVMVTWEGDLSYDLGRVEADDAPPTPPEAPFRRRPLGVKPPEGAPLPPEMFQDCCDAEQAAAILKATEKAEADNSAKVQEILQWYADHLPPQHLYVQPGHNAVIKGSSKAGVQSSFGGMTGPVNISGSGQSAQPVDYDLKGEETDLEAGFTEIEISGVPGQTNFAGTSMMTGPGARAQVNVQMDPGGMRGHAHGEDDRGHAADTDYAGASPLQPGEKTRLAGLKVEETKCWQMRGTVDATTLREMMRASGSGVDIKIVASEWEATLDERDPEFEKQVEQLASEPIPARLDWAYIDNFKDRWSALRGLGGRFMSDYKRCVLAKLEEKFVRINLAALQVYVDNFPKASEDATCGVMNAALQRILPIVRLLQLYGVNNCPLMDKVWDVASKEMQELLKKVFSRKYTMSELHCFVGAYKSGLLDFGDQAAEFQAAMNAMEQAAADARAAKESVLTNPR